MKRKSFFKSEESKRKHNETARKNVKRRSDLTRAVALYIRRWKKEAKPYTCVICGEDMKIVLDEHHINPSLKGTETYGRPDNIVMLCASCHRIIDKHGTVNDFLERHRRLTGN